MEARLERDGLSSLSRLVALAAVLNHHLLDEPPPVTDTQEGFHLGEWVREPDGWKLTHWEGVVEGF
jgi:hypothetical protein